MKELKLLVIDPVGLHFRQASLAVRAASKFKCDVTISYRGHSANMKSVMGVISLCVKTQSEVVITFEGEDEDAAAATVERILREEKIVA